MSQFLESIKAGHAEAAAKKSPQAVTEDTVRNAFNDIMSGLTQMNTDLHHHHHLQVKLPFSFELNPVLTCNLVDPWSNPVFTVLFKQNEKKDGLVFTFGDKDGDFIYRASSKQPIASADNVPDFLHALARECGKQGWLAPRLKDPQPGTP